MKVLVLPADSGACGIFRCLLPADAIHRSKIGNVEVDVRDRWHYTSHKLAHGEHWPLTGPVPDADVIILQRPAGRVSLAMIRWWQQHGIVVKLEFDDDIASIPTTNRAHSAYQQEHSNMEWINKCVAACDGLIVSTPELAKRIRHPNTVVLRNCIPQSYIDIGADRMPMPTIGWPGSISVHSGDLAVVGDAVRNALAATGWGYHHIGLGDGVGEELGIGPVEGTGWLHALDEYPKAVSSLGVGIAPLADNTFNRSKSWLRPLQFAALGVPFVATDMPEVQRLGAGILVRKPRAWEAALVKMMTDEAHRADVTAKGLQVASQWTYDVRAQEWWDGWTR